MSKVISATGSDFKELVLASEAPVLVDFWAAWCGPCVAMAPVIEELSEELKDKVAVVKIDVDSPENRTLAMSYGIRSIPNLKLFNKGEVIGEFVGLTSKEALKKEIESAVGGK